MFVMLSVFRKEMVDHLRDRRSIVLSMIYPLLGSLFLGMMFYFIGAGIGTRGHDQAPLKVPIVNPDGAPDLVRFLENRGAVIQRISVDPRGFVSGGWGAFALVLPERPTSNGQLPLPVRLISNPWNFKSTVETGRLFEYLNQYQHERVRGRLDAAGISPDTLNVIDLMQENIGRAVGPAVLLLSMIPPFLIFTLFTGSMQVALDSLSGERERGSFEALMVNPVTREQVLIGKLGAATVFTLLALAVQVIALEVVLNSVPTESLGLIAPPDLLRVAIIGSLCLPLVFLVASMQLLISGATRSIKEAQTYLGLFPLIPGAAGMVLAFAPVNAGPLLASIPTFGQTVLMGRIFRDEALDLVSVGITVVSTLIVTALLLYIGFRLFRREVILFPR
jgi:sodium transport system permease protein